jgi:hypothetical protein
MSKLTIPTAVSAATLALLPAAARADRVIASTVTPEPASTTAGPLPAEAPKPIESAPAPDYDEPDRVLLPGKAKHGGFGGPELKLTTMTGDAAILMGGQGGWIINHGFVIGGAGYGLTTTHDAPATLSRPNTRSSLQFGYGGLRLSYIVRPHDVVHFTMGLLVGAGGYSILSRNDAADSHMMHDGRAFFVTEPQGEIETNVLRYLRVGFGFSYRFIGTRSVPGLDASDLSGPAASILVKAGVF